MSKGHWVLSDFSFRFKVARWLHLQREMALWNDGGMLCDWENTIRHIFFTSSKLFGLCFYFRCSTGQEMNLNRQNNCEHISRHNLSHKMSKYNEFSKLQLTIENSSDQFGASLHCLCWVKVADGAPEDQVGLLNWYHTADTLCLLLLCDPPGLFQGFWTHQG